MTGVSSGRTTWCVQAISNYRATLSGTRSSEVLLNDDKWILDTKTNTPVLVPSNGYTFERTDWQVPGGFRTVAGRLRTLRTQFCASCPTPALEFAGDPGPDPDPRRLRIPIP